MGQIQKQDYVKAVRPRYRKANRKGKAKILDEFCAVCDCHRKYAIGLLSRRGRPNKGQKKRGRGRPRYEAEKLIGPLKAIWLATDQICSKRLKSAIPEWLPHYEQEQGILDDLIRGQLCAL